MDSARRKTNRLATVNYVDVDLTLRELDVAQLIFSGMTCQETANKLLLSKRTIDGCMAGLRAKLGVSNKLELFTRLKELGIVR